jgi:hypothetical protein
MAPERELLGHVDVTSGTLLIFDFGVIGAFAEPGAARAATTAALEMGKTEVPIHGYVTGVMVRGVVPGRYAVSSERLLDGDFAGLRRVVTIDLAGDRSPAVRTVALGNVAVDCARMGIFDVDAIEGFDCTTPVDGLADVVLWGGDGDEVAERFAAPRLEDGTFGFVDLPVEEALAIARRLDALRTERVLRFAFDLRPHTDDFFLLGQIRKSPSESGTIEVGGQAVCGFMTTWGDGFFPASLELGDGDRPLRVVVTFETEDSLAAMREVNGEA